MLHITSSLSTVEASGAPSLSQSHRLWQGILCLSNPMMRTHLRDDFGKRL